MLYTILQQVFWTHCPPDKENIVQYHTLVKENYNKRQRVSDDKTPSVTTSTEVMDTEEGDTVTQMILDNAKSHRKQI